LKTRSRVGFWGILVLLAVTLALFIPASGVLADSANPAAPVTLPAAGSSTTSTLIWSQIILGVFLVIFVIFRIVSVSRRKRRQRKGETTKPMNSLVSAILTAIGTLGLMILMYFMTHPFSPAKKPPYYMDPDLNPRLYHETVERLASHHKIEIVFFWVFAAFFVGALFYLYSEISQRVSKKRAANTPPVPAQRPRHYESVTLKIWIGVNGMTRNIPSPLEIYLDKRKIKDLAWGDWGEMVLPAGRHEVTIIPRAPKNVSPAPVTYSFEAGSEATFGIFCAYTEAAGWTMEKHDL
jgi:hypothetical protein